MPQTTLNREDIGEEDSLWAEGSFIETMGPESKAKMRTFHMKHNEEMNYNCKSCKVKISAHNKDWHNGMCDTCFDGMLEGNEVSK